MALKNIKWPSKSSDKSGEESANHFTSAPGSSHFGKFKWRTILGLLLMYVAVALNWQWIWGAFCLYWIIPDFFTGVTYFIEPIYRKENPILYWFIMINWVAFSVAMIFPSFY